jgi:diguanylate cyclase (GGDEF)-like protein
MNRPAGSFAAEKVIGLGHTALDRLMPMHLWIDRNGTVIHAGPTLARLEGAPLAGRSWDDVVTLRRPRPTRRVEQLVRMQGVPLKLALNSAPDLSLKGHVVALPEDQGALIHLSLGISLIDAVGRFDLTLQDFAPTDLAVELLYLNEAKAAVTGEFRRLAQQLNGARVLAEVEAATDKLTGLANRRGLDGTLDRLVAARKPFALMQIDLDYFKAVNDTHGHAAGDAVLRRVGSILRAHCRNLDLVARTGGDEFVIVFVELVDPAQLAEIADRLIALLEEPILVRGTECRISASIGISLSTCHDRPDPDRLLQEADVALYASKRDGRARATIASDPIGD